MVWGTEHKIWGGCKTWEIKMSECVENAAFATGESDASEENEVGRRTGN